MTKLYKIKHDNCNFEFITKGMPIIGTGPNIHFPNELWILVSTLNKVHNVIKEWSIPNVIEQDKLSNHII